VQFRVNTSTSLHVANQVNCLSVEWIPQHSPRGYRTVATKRLHLEGFVKSDEAVAATAQTDLESKSLAIINAYLTQNITEAALYDDSGVRTHISLQEGDTLSGIRVVRFGFHKGEPQEFASERAFRVILEADYLQLESQLIQYQESMQIIGTGGPVFDWQLYFDALRTRTLNTKTVRKFLIAPRSPQKIIQSGEAVGFEAYPIPSPPLLSFPYEDENLRVIERLSPLRNRYHSEFYTTRWSYTFTTDLIPSDAYPTLR
jgi:hypothetical protein